MNFELLVRQYLYQNKSISLPGIGKLFFGPSAQLPAGTSDKYEAVPLQDLHFEYDLQQSAESEFVKFVSTHTGKIPPLASSDVDSHFMLCRQFINIGKAYIIEGVGTIEKKDDGTYGFTPGSYIPVSDAITITHKPLKIREPQPALPKEATPRGKQVNYKNFIAIGGLLLLLGIATWAAYYFFVQNKPTDIAGAPADSTAGKQDVAPGNPVAGGTNPARTTATSADPNAYKAVFETTRDKARALDRLQKLTAYGNDVKLETQDSITFKLWVPLSAAPVDTLRKRDSLSRYFAKRVYLEKL